MSDATGPTARRPVGAPPGRRAHGLAREQAIIAAATDLFAEIGLDATTRELAARLGITQPLLYRYFDSKEALIERVLEEEFAGEWNPGWEALLADRAVPLRERLVSFYLDYAAAVLTYRRVRLLMFSGLKGFGPGARAIGMLRERVVERVLAEGRHAFSLPPSLPSDDDAGRERDAELVWNLHDSIFALAMRQHVFGQPAPQDLRATIADKVDAFLEGVPAGMARRPGGPAEAAGWAAESLATGEMVWAGPPAVPAPRPAKELGALVLEKNGGTPRAAHD
ncbi:TetR/AcrR family transcriptional regulator [Roseomonas nepalensis]|uniref:TetR/AcrR family transcriptional regulator n=1 Tax=Muricoccus nepalensis TaxID=1854500 RepID=A0A502GHL3_9PROT|nr:TetR/AcrR family transcriptional regulator [Roseomonas nepalensis]TPG60446.1 TetR/AcrR family transcriptional regulator [Roseomonas nepalensis]